MHQNVTGINPKAPWSNNYKVGLLGGNYGFGELLPVLNSIEYLSTSFVMPRGTSTNSVVYADYLGAKVTHLSDILTDEKIQSVFLAVAPASQLSLGKSILENGKDLYCEKPVGLSFAETDELNSVALEKERNVFVGFQFRFDPGIKLLKDAIDSNLFGSVNSIQTNWHTTGSSGKGDKVNWRNDLKLGGGVHREFLCHVVDYISWFTNGEAITTLQSLKLEKNHKSNLKELYLVSENSSLQNIEINISRGLVLRSYWKIDLMFESGKLNIHSEYPFNLNSYKIKFDGTTKFKGDMRNFLRYNEFSKNTIYSTSARSYALKLYFEEIILSVYKNKKSSLPNLDSARFAQKISDGIQELIQR
jgi:predicted dehydrogenase